MNPLILYPVLGGLLRLAGHGRYARLAWPASGIVAGYLITAHGPSTLLLGGLLAGFLAGGRFSSAPERASVALVFFMLIYYGGHPVALLPFLALAGAAWLDQAGWSRGRYVLVHGVLLVLVLGGVLEPWTAGAFLIGEAIYSYGGRPSGTEKRRYPGFRRRG
ncbi:MAG: hypothetical protein GXO65_04835 [Euryarchaeota archaeon]|nr:hypothetical protein [Euryarchaeota archaeon]